MRSDQVLVLLGLGVLVLFLVLSSRTQTQTCTGCVTYQNQETWTIVRDPDTHRIQTITIHRDARTNG